MTYATQDEINEFQAILHKIGNGKPLSSEENERRKLLSKKIFSSNPEETRVQDRLRDIASAPIKMVFTEEKRTSLRKCRITDSEIDVFINYRSIVLSGGLLTLEQEETIVNLYSRIRKCECGGGGSPNDEGSDDDGLSIVDLLGAEHAKDTDEEAKPSPARLMHEPVSVLFGSVVEPESKKKKAKPVAQPSGRKSGVDWP